MLNILRWSDACEAVIRVLCCKGNCTTCTLCVLIMVLCRTSVKTSGAAPTWRSSVCEVTVFTSWRPPDPPATSSISMRTVSRSVTSGLWTVSPFGSYTCFFVFSAEALSAFYTQKNKQRFFVLFVCLFNSYLVCGRVCFILAIFRFFFLWLHVRSDLDVFFSFNEMIDIYMHDVSVSKRYSFGGMVDASLTVFWKVTSYYGNYCSLVIFSMVNTAVWSYLQLVNAAVW